MGGRGVLINQVPLYRHSPSMLAFTLSLFPPLCTQAIFLKPHLLFHRSTPTPFVLLVSTQSSCRTNAFEMRSKK